MRPYKTITLRLNAAEYAHLKALSDTAGLKMEPTLRKLMMGVQLRPRPPDTYAVLLRDLSAIGNNVNQIVYNTNAAKAATQSECGLQ
nr:plasmid mobilization relaxosome protein MobC [uncultured Oscillibacter sp.]